jgi:hypothetical protein
MLPFAAASHITRSQRQSPVGLVVVFCVVVSGCATKGELLDDNPMPLIGRPKFRSPPQKLPRQRPH